MDYIYINSRLYSYATFQVTTLLYCLPRCTKNYTFFIKRTWLAALTYILQKC